MGPVRLASTYTENGSFRGVLPGRPSRSTPTRQDYVVVERPQVGGVAGVSGLAVHGVSTTGPSSRSPVRLTSRPSFQWDPSQVTSRKVKAPS
jgi:hypothetical protein